MILDKIKGCKTVRLVGAVHSQKFQIESDSPWQAASGLAFEADPGNVGVKNQARRSFSEQNQDSPW
ncbi:hypothetical protein [Desulfatiglans anilini]|uniref:hypothetical protein n=1 Tax=Desulfatiglans anilini TaxID=90728 RepID=UPI0012948389|nr:hypothetical protein [Desulfatiglans anilini]